MTVAEALRDAARQLEATSGTARLDAEVLMAHALGVTRSDLLLKHMDSDVPDSFADLLARRMQCEPVAYIVGLQEFYGRDFVVNYEVLIPRGDSETIIEAALAHAPAKARVLDCGVGTGALLLTVLAERPEAEGIGIDRSLGAMAVASLNASRLGLQERVHILHRNWHEPDWKDELGQFDLILANPPYVETTATLDPDVADWEPAEALFAGPEGLDDYRILIPQLPALLAAGGVAVLEIGAAQADSVAKIAQAAGFSTKLHRDLAGRPRALVLMLTGD
ncbi:peptide chain release factor N(5)-glutamine methyltransferase [Alteraurantiacibacter aquimixticola]|uniref:peptide chain release factor N(5)-glutamine methyltransferase n=1 Tax=Alteraurantiacibacter aquimixticola TaxID=2489173 RepID=UPI001FE7C176|nr:peptide chain release factor N(5)-glutamine methyltransferase [Alteraurantiacibacter aquimixticola]